MLICVLRLDCYRDCGCPFSRATDFADPVLLTLAVGRASPGSMPISWGTSERTSSAAHRSRAARQCWRWPRPRPDLAAAETSPRKTRRLLPLSAARERTERRWPPRPAPLPRTPTRRPRLPRIPHVCFPSFTCSLTASTEICFWVFLDEMVPIDGAAGAGRFTVLWPQHSCSANFI